jgi:hypothetical protein
MTDSPVVLNMAIKTKIQRYINLGLAKPDIASMIRDWGLNGDEELAHQYLIQASPGDFEEAPSSSKDKDEDCPSLPKEAWRGLFRKYRDLVGGTTEASDNYHWGGFMTVLGCTLNHRICVHYAGLVYPNSYICFVGPTGESRKTTGANRAKSLTLKLNSNPDDEYEENGNFQILNGIGSIEALYDSLSGRKRTRLLYYSELGSLMAKAQQSGTSNMITDLTSLWDLPDRINPSTRHIKVNCEYPFVSILSCSTLEWLYKYITLESIYSGFVNRWIFLYGEPKSAMPDPPPVDDAAEKVLLSNINDIRKWANDLPNQGLIEKSQEAQDMWNVWYTEYFNTQRDKTGILPELLIRVPVHIWKIAALYAAQDYSPYIKGEHLEIAIKIGGFLEQSMRRVFRNFNSTDSKKREDKLIDYLKKKGPMTPREIYKNLNMSAEELVRVSKPLIQMGLVNNCKIGKKDGLMLV